MKIMIDRAVVEQALEALYSSTPHGRDWTEHGLARQALSAALEQPQVEQEPVAWCHLHYCKDGSYFADCLQHYQDSYCKTPLYPHPQPHRQPLTEDGIKQAFLAAGLFEAGDELAGYEVDIARAIEAAHGITGEQA